MRPILLYGLAAGVLIALLRVIDYRFIVVEHSMAIYGGIIAAIFAAVGIRFGLTLARPGPVVVKEVPVPVPGPAGPFVANQARIDELQLTPREMDVLALMAEGLSNKEMAGRLFVSENTVKTHCSRVFGKLGAERRTQAVQIAKKLGLIA